MFCLQVKAGSVFDNILISDEPEYAKQVVQEVFANREVQSRSLKFNLPLQITNALLIYSYIFSF